MSLAGLDAGQFSLTLPDLSATEDLAVGESLDYTITFTPRGSSGLRNAIVTINSNDTDTPVFTFSISGLGFSTSDDGDSDGMNDWAEYSLRSFGFDWQTTQTDEVSLYYDQAPAAGLLTKSQLAAKFSGVLVEVDPTANTAALVIGLQKSDDLESFNPIVGDPSKLTIDDDGKIRYEVDIFGNKKFIRAAVGN